MSQIRSRGHWPRVPVSWAKGGALLVLLSALQGAPAVAGSISWAPMSWPQARGFFVTEFGAAHRLNTCANGDAIEREIARELGLAGGQRELIERRIRADIKSRGGCFRFALNRRQYYFSRLGLMLNLSQQYSVGLTHVMGMDDGGENRGGPTLTLRRWVGDRSSVDISAGFYWWDTRSPSGKPSTHVGLSLSCMDELSIVAQFESANFSDTGIDHGLFSGVRTGARPGLIINSMATMAAIIVAVGVLVTGAD